MKKSKWYILIFPIIVLVIYLLIKIYFRNFNDEIYNENKDKFMKLEFRGKVYDQLIDKNNRSLEVFALKSNDSTIHIPIIFIDSKYRNYIKIGDSLIKEKGSLGVIVYRNNKLDTIVSINSKLIQP